MKKAKRNFFLLLTCFLSAFAGLNAQDTVVAKHCLPPVDITQPARIYIANPGLIIEKPDSIQSSRYQSGTLTDMLGQNGMLFLKSYGGGKLLNTTLPAAFLLQH